VLAPRLAAQQSTEESARRLYESGVVFLQQARYDQAMQDFQNVVTSYPTSAVAADALLQVATHQLERARDPAAARTTADGLTKKYPDSDAAAMAHVVLGRSELAAGRAPADLDRALAAFERVARRFPRSDVVPVANYYAGETLRLGGQLDEAITRYREVTLQYPRSIWAARAALGAATCFSFKGMSGDAFAELQRVRLRFPDTPEAAQALAWNTTLYRLFLASGPQAAYAFSGRAIAGSAGKIRNVVALATDPADNVVVATEQATAVYKADGTYLRNVAGPAPAGLFAGASGQPVVLGRSGFQADGGGAPVGLSVPKQDGTPRRLENLTSAVTLSTGDVLVGDGDSKTILRFSPAGKPLGKFSSERADHMAINALDEIAALDQDAKTIAIVDRAGRTLRKIAPRGTGYELRQPVDLAFDALGHLFVLDRGTGTILVFDRSIALISSFTIADKAPGAFRGATSFTLDSAGRLLIYDTHTERVQIYQ
jgi:TolA-binding protein